MGNIKRRIPRSQKPIVSGIWTFWGTYWECSGLLGHAASFGTPLDAIKLYFATFKD